MVGACTVVGGTDVVVVADPVPDAIVVMVGAAVVAVVPVPDADVVVVTFETTVVVGANVGVGGAGTTKTVVGVADTGIGVEWLPTGTDSTPIGVEKAPTARAKAGKLRPGMSPEPAIARPATEDMTILFDDFVMRRNGDFGETRGLAALWGKFI